VERAAAPLVRHDRGAHLRCPDHGGGVERHRGSRGGVHRAGGARLRRGPAARVAAAAARGGELLARDPLRPRRPDDRPRARRGVPRCRASRPAARVDGAGARRARDRRVATGAQRGPAPA
jgi:hypothetical protein